MVSKRPASAAAGVAPAGKVAKAAPKPKPSPDEIKCEQVVKALTQSLDGNDPLPAEVSSMLTDMIPHTLLVHAEDRHPFQQRVVDVMLQELRKQEASLQRAIEEAEADVQQNEKDKEADETVVADLMEKFNEKRSAAQEKKLILADAAVAFRAGKEGMAEAEAKQREGNKDLDEVAGKHAGLEAVITEILEPLKEGNASIAPAMVQENADQLVAKLQLYFEVEDSLVQAAPKALAKEATARGPFDTMVANQLSEAAKKALAGFAATIKGGEATRAERAGLVTAASETLAAARDAQRFAANAFKAAEAEESAAEARLGEAQKSLKSRGQLSRTKAKVVTKAQTALASFTEGPLAALVELSVRSKSKETESVPAPDAEMAADAELPVADAAMEVTAAA